MKATHEPVGLGRRLMAIFYDALVIGACLLLLTALTTALGVQFGKMYYPLYSASILGFIFIYFGWCWTHGGQTIGMKVWHFRLYSTRHPYITWMTAISRYGSAFFSWLLLGLGFLWVLFNKDKHAWHDYFSDSYLLRVEKKSSASDCENNDSQSPTV